MSQKSDGRRNNRPPEHGKIKPREIRNPHGCRGKPREGAPNFVDDAYLKAAGHTVSFGSDGPVSAIQRLVQEEYHDALKNDDVQARLRILDATSRSADRDQQQRAAELARIIARKAELEDEFYVARKCGKTAPEILPHPAHVRISSNGIEILGPTTQQGRENWETLKGSIQVLAMLHDYARRAYRAHPCEVTRRSLNEMEAGRRKLMRRVPKGWNWRENIWTRGRSPDFDDMLTNLKELEHDFDQAGD